MNKFHRTPNGPDCLKNAKNNNKQWSELTPSCYTNVRKELLKISDDTCAYCAGIIGEKYETEVDHFQPQRGVHVRIDLIFEWSNLFPCCHACNLAKGTYWSTQLIRPDADSYSPSEVFLINSDGSLQGKSPTWSELADEIIKTCALNREGLKKRRKNAWLHYQDDPKNSLQDEYRFLKELIA